MIDHLGVQVADVEASLAFYLQAFGPIGVREAMRFPDGDTIVVGLSGPDGVPHFWLRRARRCCTPRRSGPSTTRGTTASSCGTWMGTM
jgi:catechol 2,3-dioxygenase-like lactoylglutathione lyase family enzyme